MLDYKECDMEEFNKAMEQKDEDITGISNEHLYILYTKFKADAQNCFDAFRSETVYQRSIRHRSENRAKGYKEELQKRGINV